MNDLTGASIVMDSISSADSKQKLLNKAESLSTLIQHHLFLVFSVKDDYNFEHWETELDAWFLQINDTNLKSGYSTKQLYSRLYQEPDFSMLKKLWVSKYLRRAGAIIYIYDRWREAFSLYSKILDDFSKVPLKSYNLLYSLPAYKKAISKRGTAYTLYDINSFSKA